MKADNIRVVGLGISGDALLAGMRAVVITYFPPPYDASYCKMDEAGFRRIAASAQDALNQAGYARRLALALRDTIARVIGSNDIMIQNELYLRASRPGKPSDVVGWHRESFYGAPPQTHNLWVPVANVTPDNSLRYVPGTADISNDDITILQTDDPNIPRGSDGHHIGLCYAPKRIVAGVSLDASISMNVPDGSAVLFPGELVHGAALNLTERVRFSVDLRLIAKAHASGAKSGYFVEL